MSRLENTIHVVRALVKISSALNDIDNVLYDTKLARDVKKYLPDLQQQLEKVIDDPIKTLFKSDDETLKILIDTFDNFSERVLIKDSYTTSINVTLAKLESAIYDLHNSNMLEGYIEEIQQHLYKITLKSFFKPFKNWTDKDGLVFNDLVVELNTIGEKTVILGETIKND